MTDRVRETAGDVESAVRQMYAALGDPARFDRFLHDDITIWETDQPGQRIGLDELQALRRRRSAASPRTESALPRIEIDDLLVDRWGDVAAVARYVLRARTGSGVEEFRVTDVWDHDRQGWRIVHHHAEAAPAAAATEGSSHAG